MGVVKKKEKEKKEKNYFILNKFFINNKKKYNIFKGGMTEWLKVIDCKSISLYTIASSNLASSISIHEI